MVLASSWFLVYDVLKKTQRFWNLFGQQDITFNLSETKENLNNISHLTLQILLQFNVPMEFTNTLKEIF